MKLKTLFLTTALCALCVVQASALEYKMDAPDDYLFGRPTSDDTIYEEDDPNVDRSKNTALIPPAFGSATSYLPGSGEPLTPNLIPGALSGGLRQNQGSRPNPAQRFGREKEEQGSDRSFRRQGETEWSELCDDAGNADYPAVDAGSMGNGGTQATQFTAVTNDLYYRDGSLGTLQIPALDLSVKIYEGTGSAALRKGAGHFETTSIWDGNVCLAGHNRGVANHFGKIHTLCVGDVIQLTTKLGTRTYAVTSVEKVLETDTSGTSATSDHRITLYTCVRDERDYRWCVQAVEQK